MKPIKLVFCGINSFSERTEINFEKLTANGLFGIFGETGSGKSTILDCINFALYGNIDRSKKKIDIINYNCEQAEVEYEFTMLSDGSRKKYRVERSIKKKSGLGKAMLYKYDGDKSVCVADNTTSVNAAIESIIGLNAEDFRKCIALPQGEFAQFVQCAPAERFKIIERLFSLSRYGEGLREKLNKRGDEVEARYNTAVGELAAYEGVTAESVEQSKIEYESAKTALDDLEKSGGKIKSDAEYANTLYKSKLQLESAQKELDSQLMQSDSMENFRRIIKSGPLCKRVCEIAGELEQKRREIKEEKDRAASLQGEFSTLSARYEKQVEEFAKCDFENKISDLKVKLASLESAASDIDELAETDKNLRILRDKFRTAVLNGDKLRDEECAAFKSAEDVKKRLDECVSEDLTEVLEVKLKPAILRGEYTGQIVYFGDLRESLKDYNDDSELYKFIREELTSRIKFYEGKILALQTEKVDVEETINAFKEQSAKREKLLKEYNEKSEKLAKCRQNSAVSDNQIATLKREGEKQKARYVKMKEKLDALFGENECGYSEILKNFKTKCASLIAERDKEDREKEQSKSRLDGLKIQIEKSSVKASALEDAINTLEKQLAAAVKESGYTTVEECGNVLKTLQTHADGERELSAYDEKLAALKSKIAELNAVEGIKTVDAEQVNKANSRLSDWEMAVKEKHSQVRLNQSNFVRLSELLVKKTANEDALKQIIRRRELVSQLKELTRGNKFLEYIAGEYLSDISKSASVTLLRLTGGRYFLTYDDSFYVGDNYNEGKRRGVNTLSGGETFLVSLSLALALSTAICKGSLKSIEFFFLDEGFGTLDESLVDTVMDSLEKLRSSDFTIGIISHVEELKHRIENKILVNKATETRGSTASVSV